MAAAVPGGTFNEFTTDAKPPDVSCNIYDPHNKQTMRQILLTLLILILATQTFAQVNSNDIRTFGQNLNIRRKNNVGINPHSVDHLQVPFGNLNYNGVKAVSSKFLSNAYPNDNPILVGGLFSTIGLDKVVFDKFIFQLFLYAEGDKKIVIRLINAFCDNITLSNRIYDQYKKEYAAKIGKIKKTTSSETVDETKPTFCIPIRADDTTLTFKDKNIYAITFTTKGVQFKNDDGNSGMDLETKFEIYISGTKIKLKSPYLDGFMVEDYIVDSIALDKETQSQMFFLKDEAQVKRNSFLSPARVEKSLQLYWDKSIGYFVALKSITGDDYKIFANQVTIKK
jgi:hypothetical protein